MRKSVKEVIEFVLGLVIGMMLFGPINVTEVVDIVKESVNNANEVMAQQLVILDNSRIMNEEEVVVMNEVNEVNEVDAIVTYCADGDTIVDFGAFDDEFYSYAIMNPEKGIYEFYCPELWEDNAIECEDENELSDVILTHIDQAYGTKRINIIEPELSEGANRELNVFGYTAVENELNKIDESVKELLVANDVYVLFNEELIESRESTVGFGVSGYYNYDMNLVVMSESTRNIEQALIHELGHALDDILGLEYNDGIVDSYSMKEVEFSDNADYYYQNISEYIAESIEYYYNGLLDTDSIIYQELDYVLGNI